MKYVDPSVEAVAAYVNRRALEHRERAERSIQAATASYHRGTAILFDALAGDIRANLFTPDAPTPSEEN